MEHTARALLVSGSLQSPPPVARPSASASASTTRGASQASGTSPQGRPPPALKSDELRSQLRETMNRVRSPGSSIREAGLYANPHVTAFPARTQSPPPVPPEQPRAPYYPHLAQGRTAADEAGVVHSAVPSPEHPNRTVENGTAARDVVKSAASSRAPSVALTGSPLRTASGSVRTAAPSAAPSAAPAARTPSTTLTAPSSTSNTTAATRQHAVLGSVPALSTSREEQTHRMAREIELLRGDNARLHRDLDRAHGQYRDLLRTTSAADTAGLRRELSEERRICEGIGRMLATKEKDFDELKAELKAKQEAAAHQAALRTGAEDGLAEMRRQCIRLSSQVAERGEQTHRLALLLGEASHRADIVRSVSVAWRGEALHQPTTVEAGSCTDPDEIAAQLATVAATPSPRARRFSIEFPVAGRPVLTPIMEEPARIPDAPDDGRQEVSFFTATPPAADGSSAEPQVNTAAVRRLEVALAKAVTELDAERRGAKELRSALDALYRGGVPSGLSLGRAGSPPSEDHSSFVASRVAAVAHVGDLARTSELLGTERAATAELRAKVEALERQVEAGKAEAQRVTLELSASEASRRTADATARDYHMRLEEAAAALTAARDDQATIEAENAALRSERGRLQAAERQLLEDVAAATAAAERAQVEAASLRGETNATAALRAAQAQSAAAEAEAGNAREALDMLRLRFEAAAASAVPRTVHDEQIAALKDELERKEALLTVAQRHADAAEVARRERDAAVASQSAAEARVEEVTARSAAYLTETIASIKAAAAEDSTAASKATADAVSAREATAAELEDQRSSFATAMAAVSDRLMSAASEIEHLSAERDAALLQLQSFNGRPSSVPSGSGGTPAGQGQRSYRDNTAPTLPALSGMNHGSALGAIPSPSRWATGGIS